MVTPPLPSFPSFQARWQLMHDVIQSTSAGSAPKQAISQINPVDNATSTLFPNENQAKLRTSHLFLYLLHILLTLISSRK